MFFFKVQNINKHNMEVLAHKSLVFLRAWVVVCKERKNEEIIEKNSAKEIYYIYLLLCTVTEITMISGC